MSSAQEDRFTLGRHLLWIGALGILLPLVVVITALNGLEGVRGAHVNSIEIKEALRHQQHVDMMHDAIHADVLRAMLRGSGSEFEPREQIASDLARHTAELERDLARLARLQGDETVADNRAMVEAQLQDYTEQATAIVRLADADPRSAAALFPAFDESFQELGETQASLTKLLASAADRSDANSAEHERQARRWIFAIATAMWVVLLTLAYLMFRLSSGHARLLTRLRHSRAELAATNEQLVAGQRVAHVGSWSWEPSSGRTERSDEVFRILGVSPAHQGSLQSVLETSVHPDDLDRVRGELALTLQSSDAFVTDYRIVRPNGAVRDVQSRAVVVRDAAGKPIKLSGTIQDVTDQREFERMKDGFVALMSHELRTPLTSMRGALGLLNSGAAGSMSERAQRLVAVALTSTDRLARLVNDVLDVDKMTAGQLGLELRSHHAQDLMETAVSEMHAMALEAGIALRIGEATGTVRADGDRVIQTLTNLINNAVKFSPAASNVEITARPDGDVVLFAVKDHGRGIPPDRLEAVFERFQQVEIADDQGKGGSGLGLAICKGIVEQHGGRIWVSSTPGQGSTFAFTLPRATPEDEATPHADSHRAETVSASRPSA